MSKPSGDNIARCVNLPGGLWVALRMQAKARGITTIALIREYLWDGVNGATEGPEVFVRYGDRFQRVTPDQLTNLTGNK